MEKSRNGDAVPVLKGARNQGSNILSSNQAIPVISGRVHQTKNPATVSKQRLPEPNSIKNEHQKPHRAITVTKVPGPQPAQAQLPAVVQKIPNQRNPVVHQQENQQQGKVVSSVVRKCHDTMNPQQGEAGHSNMKNQIECLQTTLLSQLQRQQHVSLNQPSQVQTHQSHQPEQPEQHQITQQSPQNDLIQEQNCMPSPLPYGGQYSNREKQHHEEHKTNESQNQNSNAQRLVVKQIRGDGNCLFSAVSDQMYGTPEFHAYIRQICIDYMV